MLLTILVAIANVSILSMGCGRKQNKGATTDASTRSSLSTSSHKSSPNVVTSKMAKVEPDIKKNDSPAVTQSASASPAIGPPGLTPTEGKKAEEKKVEENKKEDTKEEKKTEEKKEAGAPSSTDDGKKEEKEGGKKLEVKPSKASMRPFPQFVMPTESIKRKKEADYAVDRHKKICDGFYQQKSDEDDTLEKIDSLTVEKSEKKLRGKPSTSDVDPKKK
uniref:Uncharacterized protein n=1 Tax=Caenorhabditis japonica TaxID=281687 RepID=A0A8R1ICL5_CAEJA